MDVPFTDPDSWCGGFYELALEFSNQSTSRRQSVLTSLWSGQEVEGCYLERYVPPSDQPRVSPTLTVLLESRHLLGIARLPSGDRVPCGTCAISDGESDWLVFYIPLGAIAKSDPRVGGFPFGDTNACRSWREPIDNWLLSRAEQAFEVSRFELALIGFETSAADVTAAGIAASGVPADRHLCIAMPDRGRLHAYPTTRWA